MLTEIEKRGGKIVAFEAKKITNAIAKAGRATGESDEKGAKRLTDWEGMVAPEADRFLSTQIHFSKEVKESKHDRATDVPGWARYYPPSDPNQNCHDWASEILAAKYGDCDPRALKSGPGSEYSKIVKWCQRHVKKK